MWKPEDITLETLDQIEEILIVPYAHSDFAWTNSRDWHKCRYIKSFEKALDILQEDTSFRYGVDNVIHSLRVFTDNCPDRLEELRARVKEGRFYVASGGVSLARPNYVGDEAYVRNVADGKAALNELLQLDKEVDFFFNADTAIGHSQLPQILSLTGHTRYASARPEDCLNFKQIPKQFVWKGLDGSKVTVSRGDYGGFLYADYVNLDPQTQWDTMKKEFFEKEMVARLTNCGVKKLMHFYGGDDIIPFQTIFDLEIKLEDFMAEWNRRERSKMRFATPQEYFAYLESEELPVVEGVLDNCELSYNVPFKGNGSFCQKRMEMNDLLPHLEALAVLADHYGLPYPQEEIDRLWKRHYEITGHAIEFILEEDYRYLYSLAQENSFAAANLLRDITERLVARVGLGGENEYVVFNTQSFDRTEVVKLHLATAEGVSSFRVRDAQGQELPYQVIDEFTGDKCGEAHVNSMDILVPVTVPAFSATSLFVDHVVDDPAFVSGNRTYHVHAGKVARDETPDAVVDNGCFTARFADGLLHSLTTRDGTTMDAREVALATLQFQQTTPTAGWCGGWNVEKVFPFAPEKSCLLMNGPVTWKYQTTGTLGPHKATLITTIHQGDPLIQFEARIDSVGKEGYFTAEFDCDNDTPIQADIPYGVEERNLKTEFWYHHQTPGEETIPNISQEYKGQFFGRTFATFEREHFPLALISESGSIYYRWHETEGKMALFLNRDFDLAAPERSDGRREFWFKQCPQEADGVGRQIYRYSLLVRDKNVSSQTDVILASRRRHFPLDAARRFSKTVPCAAQKLLTVDSDHVVFTALYKKDNSWFARFYETAGQEAQVKITTRLPAAKAEKVDLLERTMQPLALTSAGEQKSLSLSIRPWEIVTLKWEAQTE